MYILYQNYRRYTIFKKKRFSVIIIHPIFQFFNYICCFYLIDWKFQKLCRCRRFISGNCIKGTFHHLVKFVLYERSYIIGINKIDNIFSQIFFIRTLFSHVTCVAATLLPTAHMFLFELSTKPHN